MPEIDTLAPPYASPPAATFPLTTSAASREGAELSRLIGRGCYTALPSLEADAVLRVQLSNAMEATKADWSSALTLHGSFGAIEIAAGARLLRALCGIDVEQERGADAARWTWLQAAILGRLSDTPLHCAAMIDFASGETSSDMETVALSLRTGTHAIQTFARGDAASLLEFMRSSAWQREQQPIAELLNLQFDAAVIVARHTLPAAALRGIAAGDIIVPDSPAFTCGGEGAFRLGAMHARVRYDAPGLLTVIALEEKVDPMDVNEYDQADDSVLMALSGEDEMEDGVASFVSDAAAGFGQEANGTAGLDTVPVTIEFELGKVRMPLGELRQLGVGTVLPFDGGSPAAVAIVSSGCTLGRGEIVDVNGQLGIRITQWSKTR
jgi:type III secretion protein Q